ncbi:MAG TPA: ribosome small subunit-dependent GTPase A [Burkholderiaceae bacterium]|nr:ribosome small subunit-dependent GTPase A [Burkholderiaceae bacterium]
MSDTGEAFVLAAYGRQFWLAIDAGGERLAVTRGRNADVVAGDRVAWRELGAGQAVIERVLPRRNLLRRSDQRRTKALAANLDQAAIVLSGEPPFSEELLLRVLIAAEREGIECLLVATKADVPGAMASIEPRLAVHERLGYPVERIDTRSRPDDAVAALRPRLANRTTLLLGQSGMGKSTLVNRLVPHAELATQTISEALQTGKHTTTFTRAFDLEGGGRLIDSPGFQVFGLAHLSPSEIEHGLREFQPLLGHCRFHNCSHRHEPGCAVRGALEDGRLDPRRFTLYEQLRREVDPR